MVLLILGCPRSGTSYISSICEYFGYNFNINSNNNLNLIYKPYVNYYQLKDLHFKLLITDVKDFKMINNFDFSEYKDYQIIKEPYLLFVLNSIIKYVNKIILVIRNPIEVKNSWINFFKSNDTLSDNIIDKYVYDKWEKYYITFLENILLNNFKNYYIVNYNNISNKINNLSNFLEISINNKKEINLNNKNINEVSEIEDLQELPITTKFLYLEIIKLSNNNSNSNSNNLVNIIKTYYKLKKQNK